MHSITGYSPDSCSESDPETGVSSDSGIFPAISDPEDGRRSGGDRRGESERRRSAAGLFELRARREGLTGDRRRQGERRDVAVGRWWRALWRRER